MQSLSLSDNPSHQAMPSMSPRGFSRGNPPAKTGNPSRSLGVSRPPGLAIVPSGPVFLLPLERDATGPRGCATRAGRGARLSPGAEFGTRVTPTTSHHGGVSRPPEACRTGAPRRRDGACHAIEMARCPPGGNRRTIGPTAKRYAKPSTILAFLSQGLPSHT